MRPALDVSFGFVLVVAIAVPACKRKKPEPFTDVWLTASEGCGRLRSGEVVCWGGDHGDRIDVVDAAAPAPKASPSPSPSPPPAPQGAGLEDALEIAAGRAHACARRRDRTVVCWGDNRASQLAQVASEERREPTLVQGIFGVEQIVAAGDGTCVRLAEGGEIRCWGRNDVGQLSPTLPRGTIVNVPTAVRYVRP